MSNENFEEVMTFRYRPRAATRQHARPVTVYRNALTVSYDANHPLAELVARLPLEDAEYAAEFARYAQLPAARVQSAVGADVYTFWHRQPNRALSYARLLRRLEAAVTVAA